MTGHRLCREERRTEFVRNTWSMPLDDELSVGARLRDARERQGLPLEAVAHSLRISLKTLQALEQGDIQRLPADVYIRGFLRQYADVLGLDPVPLLRAFAIERARFPAKVTTFPWMLAGRAQARLWDRLTPRALAVLGGGAVLLIVFFYVVLQVRTYARPPRLDVFEPPQDIEVREPTVTVRGRTDATAEISINGEQTAVRSDGTFEEALGVGEGVNTLRVVARSIGGRETIAVREVLLRPADTLGTPETGPKPGTQQPVTGMGPFSLTVRAEGEAVWVQLTVDRIVAFSGLLLPTSERTVSGKEISITSGKAGRTLININGEDQGVLADTPGTVRDVVFTRNQATGTIERHASTKVPSE